MELIDLLKAVREAIGHNNVTWDIDYDNDNQIIFHTGLTAHDADGNIMSGPGGLTLRKTDATVAYETMGD